MVEGTVLVTCTPKRKKFNHMLEINILRNYFAKNLVVLRGELLGFGYPKDSQTKSILTCTPGYPMSL